MKKYLYLIVVVSSLVACGGSGDDPAPIPVVENKIPSIPVLVAPVNNLLCSDNTVSFNWDSSLDLDGDAIKYTIQIAKDNQFSQIVHDNNIPETAITFTLDKGKAYYWRVKATDSKSLSSSYSTVFNFYTEGEGEKNHLPFSPELVKPELNSVVQTTTATLEWSASDVDTGDTLTFDVFFGTTNLPVTKIGNNQTAKKLDVNIEPSKSYYWKVLVKDGKGGETIGQIWNFKTD